MSKVSTSPEVSARHAFIFENELRAALSEQQMIEASRRHSQYLIGKDKTRMLDVYVENLKRFRRHK